MEPQNSSSSASICASVSSDKKIDTTNQSVPTCIDGERGSSATKIAPCSSSSSSSSSSPTVKNRCRSCNKKVGLTGFACRCGKVFCGMHRYSDEHRCTFDYKEFDRQILVKHNPVIRGDKLDDRV
ncbi:zinc finger protein, putative [Ricinus communis]|uniref:Zinc finger protein, putative n=1 Tax=Ricinus communis TaxID=3988 RepID=B9SKY6_RICCO|nr:zinc finger protein, putative [Ricinus communis]